jgi:hypothetical protein
LAGVVLKILSPIDKFLERRWSQIFHIIFFSEAIRCLNCRVFAATLCGIKLPFYTSAAVLLTGPTDVLLQVEVESLLVQREKGIGIEVKDAGRRVDVGHRGHRWRRELDRESGVGRWVADL